MPDYIRQILSRLRETWDGMNLNQRVITGAVIAALFVVAIVLSTLRPGPGDEYTVLFARLDAVSANEVKTRLDQQKIPYKITQNGTAIEVPQVHADRLKIEMTAEGLPESGIVGYELLDTTNFGMSDFLQKVNLRRAMEGELVKTLRTLDEVEDARVHLVIPEPTIFTETAGKPSASIVLKLKRGKSLSPQDVETITNLVASAVVEGLEPSDVTVADTKGNLLTRPTMDEFSLQSSTMMELKWKIEQNLVMKVKSMLDGAYGMGIAMVTVNADLNYDRIERMSTLYDQEHSAVVSEEISEVTNPTAEGGGEESRTTNYDTGQVVETLVQTPGNKINRLTVSVMIDGKDSTWVDDGTKRITKVPWSESEIEKIRNICETAVGYNPDRGDRIIVANMLFDVHDVEIETSEASISKTLLETAKSISLGFAILVALAIFFVLIRSLVQMLDPTKMKLTAEEEFEKLKPILPEEQASTYDNERAELLRRIKQRSQKNPEIAARTLKSLYHDEF